MHLALLHFWTTKKDLYFLLWIGTGSVYRAELSNFQPENRERIQSLKHVIFNEKQDDG
jgi:hypothetical protein